MATVPSNQVTELLARWSQGETAAREKLVPLVYDELRRMASHSLAGERSDHTLQSAVPVHETYLRLVGHSSVYWNDRVHFFGVAAQLMRRILVDHARKHLAEKRGSDNITLSLDERFVPPKSHPLDVVALDVALNELGRMNPEHSRIIELGFFALLSLEETAQALGISLAAVKREWAVARAWLYRELARK